MEIFDDPNMNGQSSFTAACQVKVFRVSNNFNLINQSFLLNKSDKTYIESKVKFKILFLQSYIECQ